MNSAYPLSLSFIEEIDRLKAILRQTLTYDGTRRENTAEHSWHLAIAVMVSAPHANEPFNMEQAMKMALIHDIVEIDAGDTFIYDPVASLDKAEREKEAAERIFGLLPEALSHQLRQLWDAYEARRCPESRFVHALDRLLPILANYKTKGIRWQKNGIVATQVLEKNQSIAEGSRELWDYAKHIIEESVRLGYLPASRPAR